MPKKRQQGQAQFHPHKSLLWHVAAYMLLMSVVTVATLSVSSFFIARSYVQQSTLVQLASLVAAKEDLIEGRLYRDRERTTLLSLRKDIVQMAKGTKGNEIDSIFVQLINEGVPVVGMTLFTQDGSNIQSAGVATIDVPDMPARTILVPLVGKDGWNGHTVFSQVRDSQNDLQGFLAVQFDVKELLANILTIDVFGDTAETLIGQSQGEDLVLLHHRYTDQFGKPLILGSLADQYKDSSVLARALTREEGVHEAEDYQGEQVFAAYRYLPTLGWGLVVKVDKWQALAGVLALGATLTIVSFVLLILTTILSVIIARNITGPLRKLCKKVSKLGPGHWGYRKSVHTGDEVEVLDHVAADLAKRLKYTYENLEEEVRERTAALTEEYEKDRTILESIQHGIVVVDKKGIVTALNTAADELIGCGELACLGRSVLEVIKLHRHKRSVTEKEHPVLKCIHKKVPVRSAPEIRWSILHCRNNTLIPISLSVTPILDGKKLLGAIAVFYDITEDRRVDYLKSEFISLASHQLRTPLSSLQWYIELFTSKGEKKLSGGQSEYLKEMDKASKRMSKLVDALLHAARLEGQAVKPQFRKIDLKEFMEDMAEEFRSLAKASKISCDVHIPEKNCAISTDPILLHIVFQNLFSNAVKYTKPGGQVEIALTVKSKSYDLTVKDTGVGIPKEDQKRIFERLFRADNVRQMDTDGSGLGLYISRMVMKSIGGTISFSSTEKKGTVFTVSLPKTLRKTPKKKSSESSQ